MVTGLGLFLFAPLATACGEKLPEASITIKGHALSVELAFTPKTRACGLSHRSKLRPYNGMLFIYPNSRTLSFWMKDTRIPLSIAFINEAGQIMSIQKMSPMQSGERYRPPKPVRYALEVNQGWFEKHNIAVGDVVGLNIPAVLNIR